MTTDRVIAALAARQRGVIGARQLHAAGVDNGAIQRRLRAGRLHRLHRGVYVVGHTAAAEGAAEIAAVLACGSGSVISHRSAARLWGLSSFAGWEGPVEVTVAGRAPGRRSGIRVYRARQLDRRDARWLRGIPITSPARTLLDVAAVVPFETLESVFADARARRLLRTGDLVKQLERHRGRRGVRALRQLVDLNYGRGMTRSKAERKLIALVQSAGLPAPKTNARLGRFEVDLVWREQRVIVEVDGYTYHSDTRAFERDRARDAVLVASGYAVTRVTWRQLVARPEAVIARIAAALAVRAVSQ